MMPKRYRRHCNTCGKFYHGRGEFYCSNQCKSTNPVWRENYLASAGRFVKGGKPWNKDSGKATNPANHIRLINHIKKKGPWNKGTTGVVKKNSGSFTSERVRGSKNHNWKGGITPENQRIRRSKQYSEWRMEVYRRDHFRCVMCGYRSKKPKDIRADHIKPFCLYPELRFDLNNGRTLCVPCDLKHGWNSLKHINKQINYHNIKKGPHVGGPQNLVTTLTSN